MFSYVVYIGLIWTAVTARRFNQVLKVTNGGQWGTWRTPELCADGDIAVGYSLKIEKVLGGGNATDDTSLNAIRLKCGKPGCYKIDDSKTVSSDEGELGEWRPFHYCPYGQVMSEFSLQVEPYQGTGTMDDTGANYINFKYKDREGSKSAITTIGGEGWWGTFGLWSRSCPIDSAICGLSVKLQDLQGEGVSPFDDTALNDVRFYCCKI